MAIEREIADLAFDFTRLTTGLRLSNPMSIENFLNPVEENDVHHFMTDTELLAAAQTVEEESEPEDMEESRPVFGMTTKLHACSTMLLVLEGESDWESEEMQRVIGVLRKKQKALHRAIAQTADLNGIQQTITRYFS